MATFVRAPDGTLVAQHDDGSVTPAEGMFPPEVVGLPGAADAPGAPVPTGEDALLPPEMFPEGSYPTQPPIADAALTLDAEISRAQGPHAGMSLEDELAAKHAAQDAA